MSDIARSRRSRVRLLTLTVSFLGFFALATLGWLIWTPQETTLNYSSNGQLVSSQSDLHYSSLIVPGLLCSASLLAFTASALTLARTLREGAEPA